MKGMALFVLFVFAFGTLYGAIPGALVMGIITFFRWRRPREPFKLPIPGP